MQAQKLISLCGWEPRSLPYVVSSKDGSNQSAKNGNTLTPSSLFANRQYPSINLKSASIDKITEADENSNISTGVQSDTHSVVLDCKLCGASVGLWAFSTVTRPMELFRLVGYTEVNSENDPGTHDLGNINQVVDDGGGVISTTASGATSLKEGPKNLNLTIAGGPPPTKQNFKATISLPVIGQNLRSRFSYDSEFRDRIYVNQEEIRSDFQNKNLFQEKNDHAKNTDIEHLGLLNSNRRDHGWCSSTCNDQSHCLNRGSTEKDDALRKENDNEMLEGTSFGGQGTSPEVGRHNSIEESMIEGTQNVAQSSSQNGILPENEEIIISYSLPADDSGTSQVRDPSIVAPDSDVTIRNGESSKDDSLVMVAPGNCNLQQISGTDKVQYKEISLATDRMQIPENNESMICSTSKTYFLNIFSLSLSLTMIVKSNLTLISVFACTHLLMGIFYATSREVF